MSRQLDYIHDLIKEHKDKGTSIDQFVMTRGFEDGLLELNGLTEADRDKYINVCGVPNKTVPTQSAGIDLAGLMKEDGKNPYILCMENYK